MCVPIIILLFHSYVQIIVQTLKIETRFLDRKWKRRFRKNADKFGKCYKTVFEAILDSKALGYEPTIYLVNFFFRLETWHLGEGTYHTAWNINGPDPLNSSREAIFLPVQIIERLAHKELMATLAHEMHEILGKTLEGRLPTTSFKEARQIVHKRRLYDLFKEPIRSLLINWDALPSSVKSKKVRLSKTCTKTFRDSQEIRKWFKTSAHENRESP